MSVKKKYQSENILDGAWLILIKKIIETNLILPIQIGN